MKRVAIIGADGFIGNSLSQYLQNESIEVVRFNSSNPPLVDGRLSDAFQNISTVIWCASRVNPVSAEKRPDLVDLELSEWKLFLHRWQKDSNLQAAIIFLSSGGCVYSQGSDPFHESSPANGINKYGKLKIKMEQEISGTSIPFTILRISNVYGAGQPHGRGQGVIAEWKHSLENKNDIRVYGSLESFRDYIYIDDLCQAIFKLSDFQEGQRVLNVGSGIPTKLSEILEVFIRLKSQESNVLFSNERPTDRNGYCLDIEQIRSLTGWEPRFLIENGLRRTIGNFNDAE